MREMDMLQVLHMNKGDGEISYTNNSSIQAKVISILGPVIKNAIQKALSKNIPKSVGIADLGCSSGPNALLVPYEIIDTIYNECRNLDRPMPEEFRIYLNDLPTNDFNNIFVSLPDFYNKLKAQEKKGSDNSSIPCFVLGVPGSFYGRLFHKKSIHFLHSSSSLQWLSQVPQGLDIKTSPTFNKGNIMSTRMSPASALNAYATQYQNDFSLFLKSRSIELVSNGRMLLSFLGTDIVNELDCHQTLLGLLAEELLNMVSEGIVDEEKFDSFNLPIYLPTIDEVKMLVEKEGSFIIDLLEAHRMDSDWGGDETLSSGARMANNMRVVFESLLEYHFESHIIDELFRRYSKIIDTQEPKITYKFTDIFVSLIRKED